MPDLRTEHLSLRAENDDGRNAIALSGSFTFASHAAFRDVLLSEIGRMPPGGEFVIDLRDVTFIDSAALGMLLLARQAARQRSGTVSLRGAQGHVQKMLSVSRFELLFPIAP